MDWAKLWVGLRRGNAAYWKGAGLPVGISFLVIFVLILSGIVSSVVDDFRFRHLSASEHLQLALSACGAKTVNSLIRCASPDEAKLQLGAIPADASEYQQATSLRSAIEQGEAQQADEARRGDYKRYQANMSGAAHDPFTCATSTENKPVVSFDGGTHWWADDGRCQTRLQKGKDANAETSSYWSTTLRVDTDMDSFWLPDEERICQTYPDDKGRVSVVACNSTGNHRDHNIPVKFWGGTERNTVSNWRCRREKDLLRDEFVCRAVD